MPTFDPNEPLRWDMILPNGQPLRFDTPGARWDGTVGEVMQALEQQQNQQPQDKPMLALSTTLLTTEELTAACARLSAVWTPLLATNPVLSLITAAADTNCAAILTAGTRQPTSDFTEALKTADDARDSAFISLRNLISAAAQNPISPAEQRAAGERLQAIVARHGNRLYQLGYTRETGKLQALFTDLRTADSTADLALLGLTALFTHLTGKQADFEKVVADKTAAESGISLPTVSENRPQLEHRMNLLLDTLVDWHALAPTPALTTAIEQMDEIITDVMTPALARRTRAGNAAAAAKPAAPQPPAAPGA